MKKTTQAKPQQELLRAARKQLGEKGKPLTNAELAVKLGKKSAAGILAWLAPESSGKHRTMPKGARMLLAALMAAKRAK